MHYPESIIKPYVTFCMQEGLIGHNTMIKDAIRTEELTKMRYAQFSSTTGKVHQIDLKSAANTTNSV